MVFSSQVELSEDVPEKAVTGKQSSQNPIPRWKTTGPGVTARPPPTAHKRTPLGSAGVVMATARSSEFQAGCVDYRVPFDGCPEKTAFTK